MRVKIACRVENIARIVRNRKRIAVCAPSTMFLRVRLCIATSSATSKISSSELLSLICAEQARMHEAVGGDRHRKIEPLSHLDGSRRCTTASSYQRRCLCLGHFADGRSSDEDSKITDHPGRNGRRRAETRLEGRCEYAECEFSVRFCVCPLGSNLSSPSKLSFWTFSGHVKCWRFCVQTSVVNA